jgi:hypothetical protein
MASRDPFKCCPICGTETCKCGPQVYRAIDAANTRAANNDDIASDRKWYPPPRDYVLRLKEGFQMMDDDY